MVSIWFTTYPVTVPDKSFIRIPYQNYVIMLVVTGILGGDYLCQISVYARCATGGWLTTSLGKLGTDPLEKLPTLRILEDVGRTIHQFFCSFWGDTLPSSHNHGSGKWVFTRLVSSFFFCYSPLPWLWEEGYFLTDSTRVNHHCSPPFGEYVLSNHQTVANLTFLAPGVSIGGSGVPWEGEMDS